ncbi:MAG: low molecular weight protein-tyrosine-phosphatase [Rhizomicrobium sp.]
MSEKLAVLFVCLGNICRSPMAEAAFRAECARRNLEINCDSVGIGDWHEGQSPDPRACDVAKAHGVDIEGHKARQIREKDFYHYDLVLGLDREITDDLKRLSPPGAPAHVDLLMNYVHGKVGTSVPDPYYGGAQEFDDVWAMVAQAARALTDRLTEDAVPEKMAAAK